MDIGWEVDVTLEDGIIRWNRIIVVWSSEGIHFFQNGQMNVFFFFFFCQVTYWLEFTL